MRRRLRDKVLRAACWGAVTASGTLLVDCSRSDSPSLPTAAPDTPYAFSNDRVAFPRFADEAVTIRDPRTGMSVQSRLRESAHAVFENRGDHAVAVNAVRGGSVALRSTENGVEDFVSLASPAVPLLSYELTLDARVAGLRLVENTLELLDHDGFPRLRAEPPYLVDASRKRLPIALAVEGCAVSTDPAAPFHHAVTAPRSRSCVLRLSWNPNDARYPIVVDPAWSTTGAMATPRFQHVSIVLANGSLLVAGGFTGDPSGDQESTATAELYAGGAWASTGSLLETRAIGAAAALGNGDILVTGGLNQNLSGQNILGTSEVYSVTAGTWSSTGALLTARSGHSATAVGDGTVLVAGGYDNSGGHYDSAELYSSGHFVAAGTINTARFDHVAVELSGNRVLLGAGTNAFSGALDTLELYTAGSGWASAASLATMATPRLLMTAAHLPNDDVVFIGGYNATSFTLGTTETYRPSTNSWTTGSGTMLHPRYDAASTLLSDGRILVVGGEDNSTDFRDGEIYDPTTTQFTDFCGMSDWRAFGQSANSLIDGGVVVAGGYAYRPPRILAATDLFDPAIDDAGVDAAMCVRPPFVPDAGPDASDAASEDAAATDAEAPRVDASVNPDASSGADAGGSALAAGSGFFGAGGGCTVASTGDSGTSRTFSIATVFGALLLLRRRRRHAESG